MRIFSVYDLPGGTDRAEFITREVGFPAGDDALRAFVSAEVRFHERGESSEPRSPEGREEALIVMQGRGRIVVNGVEHPVAFGDVVILGKGDTYQVVSDEIDPFVLLTLVARTA